MDMFLKVIAVVFFVAGAIVVFGSRYIVERFQLYKNSKCEFEDQMNEEEIKQYKTRRAELNIKMFGMLIVLPGIILMLIKFK